MLETDLEARVRQCLGDAVGPEFPATQIARTTSLYSEEIGLDSLTWLAFEAAIEREFEVPIDDAALVAVGLGTVADLMEIVRRSILAGARNPGLRGTTRSPG